MLAGRAASSTRIKPGHAKLKQLLFEDWAAKRFHVEYQPQVDLRSRKIVRFEALLRWERPGKTSISPKDFIPLAEESGLIGEIGQWVLERACADAMLWPEEIGIAVNVSATSLRNPSLPAVVIHALEQSRLSASRLELEITESAKIAMDSESRTILQAIQKLGVRVTIDDLDVGYSSLRYLLDFPFDKIKVDGLYTRELGREDARSKAAFAIMRSIAELCRTLGIASLAEAVETEAQLALVMECNFSEVQGYIFGESVGVDKIEQTILHTEQVWQKLTIRKRNFDELSFFQVADEVNDIIIVTDAQLAFPGPAITYVNPAFTRLTGYAAEEAIGMTPRMLQGPGTCRTTLDNVRTALNVGQTAHEKVLNYTKSGAPYWLDMRIEPMRDALGVITHFVGIERDVTLDKRRLDELEYVADRDILTGIPNRRAFLRAIDAEIAHCRQAVEQAEDQRPLCIAWIDVDRFKEINDSLGHAVGDAVLFRIADRLAENMRRVDTIGRLGGEEFAVCMPALTVEAACSQAERLRESVSAAAIETAAGAVSIAISIGVAELLPAEDAASLMARADAAMYEAKRAGGNRVCTGSKYDA